MARIRIATLAISAFALAALPSAGAFGQTLAPVGPWTQTNPPPFPTPSRGYDNQNQATVFAPQLFGFASVSNKSGGLGEPGCRAASDKTKSRPKVVATFPAEGAVVRPGVVVVRVTFDQPMACDASFAGTSDLPNPCPGRWREVTISPDRHSFRAVCEVKAGTRYRLTLRSFHNAHGLAVPAEVTFSTSGSAPVGTIQEALAEDASGPAVAGG
jgi:hypothetical protein